MTSDAALVPPIAGIVGPTASGKSELAMALAERVPLEVLVADSRQVYRAMDVGTAKPDAVARASVPHHLLDLVEPDVPFTVADWVRRARAIVPEVVDRGRLPLLVGGTGLYVTSLIDGYDFAQAAWAPDARERLTAEFEAEGLEPLAARLQRLDPQVAGRIDLRNPRRVLRALERAEASGTARQPPGTPWPAPVALLGLARPRAELYRRIDDRARALLTTGGLLDEVRRLLDAGYSPDLRPMTGHGYREAARHLAGEWSLEEAIDVTARRTRQYAKRQLSWFGRDRRVVWLPAGDGAASEPDLVARAAELIRALTE